MAVKNVIFRLQAETGQIRKELEQIKIHVPSEPKNKNKSGEIVSLDDFRDKK